MTTHTEKDLKPLPEPNKRVVAFLKGSKHHSDVGWVREGWAFMVRWENTDPGHTVADGWARSFYDDALKQIDADYAEVNSWVYVSDLPNVTPLREALDGLLEDYDPERAVIDVDPSPSCFECTSGTVPNRLNKGLCHYHKALAALNPTTEGQQS